jgi:hypothetical protein
LAIGLSTILSAWAYVLIALGFDPESIWAAEQTIPFLALFVASFLGASSQTSRSRQGFSVVAVIAATALVSVWFFWWCYLMSRWQIAFWWRDGVGTLRHEHIVSWIVAILVAGGAALCGERVIRPKAIGLKTLFSSSVSAAMIAILLVQAVCGKARRASEGPYGQEIELARGVTLRAEPILPDGTIVRLISYDFMQNRQMRVRVYDCDFDDASPRDNNNTTYMGQTLEMVARKLQDRESPGRRMLTVCNGGFFGEHGRHIAHHEAPIVIDGESEYNLDLIRPKEQAWLFGVRRDSFLQNGEPRFQLIENISWADLAEHFETALGGVRPLRVAGESVALLPGIGGTSLRCSRTSIGWPRTAITFICWSFAILTERDRVTYSGSWT